MKTRLTGDPGAPRRARDIVARHLATRVLPDGVTIDDVLLTVSELVTNAVQAGAGWIDLTVQARRQRLDLFIEDDALGMPSLSLADEDAVHGRGLAIVDRLTDSWLVTSGEDRKVVVATWLDRPTDVR